VGAAGVVWSARLVVDPRRWGSVSGLPADVLADAATHLVDLVPWLLGSPIQNVEGATYARRNGPETIVRFRVVCANGTTMDCLAGHGLRYDEEIVCSADRKTWIAQPRATGSARLRTKWLRAGVSTVGTAEAAVRKALGQPSTAQRSVAGLLEKFAERMRGGPPGPDDPDALAGLRASAVVEAIYTSLESNGNVRAVASVEGVASAQGVESAGE
jgi:predicted dehydrogenase